MRCHTKTRHSPQMHLRWYTQDQDELCMAKNHESLPHFVNNELLPQTLSSIRTRQKPYHICYCNQYLSKLITESVWCRPQLLAAFPLSSASAAESWAQRENSVTEYYTSIAKVGHVQVVQVYSFHDGDRRPLKWWGVNTITLIKHV